MLVTISRPGALLWKSRLSAHVVDVELQVAPLHDSQYWRKTIVSTEKIAILANSQYICIRRKTVGSFTRSIDHFCKRI